MKVSIIVPVMNEGPQIQPFLLHLRARAAEAEIIVVDGGSSDGTAELAENLCDQLIRSEQGRPLQMNKGAKAACGEILWFLHADCEVPQGCISLINHTLQNENVAGGYFRVQILNKGWIYRIHDGLGHYIGKLLRVRCGDHGIFIRSSLFESAGGYAPIPIMEDVDLFRKTHTFGQMACLPERLIISTRRHEQVGVYRYSLVCAIIVALYCLRLPATFLAKLYESLVPIREDEIRLRPLPAVEPELFSEYRPSRAQSPAQAE